MRAIITKASDDYYFKPYKFTDIAQLKTLIQNETKIIIGFNSWEDESIENIMKYCEVDEKLAKKISKSTYEIKIYDDYVE